MVFSMIYEMISYNFDTLLCKCWYNGNIFS